MFRRSQSLAAFGGLSRTQPLYVHLGIQKYTKEGQARTRGFLQGPAEFERRWWQKLHPSKLACIGCLLYAVSPYFDFRKEIPENEKFLNNVNIQAHGVLGDVFAMTFSNHRVASYPDENTVIVDPTCLENLAVNPEGAGGASGGIYNWLNLKGKFPDTVKDKLYGMCDAKSQTYQDGPGSQKKTVVHVVSPDFRIGAFTEREAVLLMAKAYRNVFAEFVRTGKSNLRIAPIAQGHYSGDLTDQIYPLTQEAMLSGFEQLHPFDRKELLKAKIDLCIFMEKDWDKFCKVWQHVTPASRANPAIPASVQKSAAAV